MAAGFRASDGYWNPKARRSNPIQLAASARPEPYAGGKLSGNAAAPTFALSIAGSDLIRTDAPRCCPGAFSSREPVSTSLENALSRRLFAGEQMQQRAADRGLSCRRRDLRAQQIRDVEHVAGAFAEGRDMGGGDVEVELRDRRRQFV